MPFVMRKLLSLANAVFVLVLLCACGREENSSKTSSSTPVSPYHDIPGATYVGHENCKTCHEPEFRDWLMSDHHKAMNPATE